jgi:hypothetical protein
MTHKWSHRSESALASTRYCRIPEILQKLRNVEDPNICELKIAGIAYRTTVHINTARGLVKLKGDRGLSRSLLFIALGIRRIPQKPAPAIKA